MAIDYREMDDALNQHYLTFDLDSFVDKIVTDAILKNTRYERHSGWGSSSALYEILNDGRLGRHLVEVKIDSFDEEEVEEDVTLSTVNIEAYHLSFEDIIFLNCILNMSNKINQSIPDAPKYELMEYNSPNDIIFPVCYDPYISSYQTIKGNCYDDNMDTNGSCLGVKAVRCHLFYNVFSKKYILLEGSYWCM